jgi:hypothetical protein
MKSIYLSLAAVSALAVAAPLAAQSWHDEGSAPRSWNGERSNVAQLQLQLDSGIDHGSITRREAMPLRDSLNELIRMERHFGANGFNRQERNILQLRSASLHRQIDNAEHNGNFRDRRADRGDDGRDGYAINARGDNRGDRFAGDLRVGQHFSARQVALPIEYRDRYKDSDSVYYRYDDNRVYQIDRVSGLILAMFDIGR